MGRAFLIIIIMGGIVAAMLPSGKHAPASAPSSSGIFTSSAHRGTIHVTPRQNFSAAAENTNIGGPWTTLYRGANGHFYADAEVNGRPIHFLIDTGASGVALTTDDAQRAGLNFSPMEFSTVGSGASGEVRGKIVTLDRVSLGSHEVQGVSGVILEGGQTSLLGQSFLSQMGTIEISGDRMVIR